MTVQPTGNYGSRRAAQTAARRQAERDQDSLVVEATSVLIPSPDDSWSPLARQTYDSFLSDAVARQTWTSGDWALAYVLAETLNRADLRRGSTVEQVIAGMRLLGVGVAERQRARIKIVESVSQTDETASRALNIIAGYLGEEGGS